MPPEPDDLLTAKELATWLKVSNCWVKDHAMGRRQPFLPSIRIGGKRGLLRFRRSDIMVFLKDNEREDGR